MELELQRIDWSGFDAVLESTLYQEETLESIVPDTCPDLARVLETAATVCLTGREIAQGGLRLSGCVKLSALCLPEGEGMPRSLALTIPFAANVQNPRILSRGKVTAAPRLCAADVTIVNPRKVLGRVNLALDLQVYCPSDSPLCGDCEGPQEVGVQQRRREERLWSVTAVQEKVFSFQDILSLPASLPAPAEVLLCRLEPRCTEGRVIGSRIILKGAARLQALFRSGEGELFSHRFELPFSQILESGGAGEEGEVLTQLCVRDLSCAVDSGGVSVSLELLAQAAVGQRRPVEYIADLYGTGGAVEPQMDSWHAWSLEEDREVEQSVRELAETALPVHTVVDACCLAGGVTRKREGERLVLEVTCQMQALCQSAEGGLSALTRQVTVPVALECPGEDTVNLSDLRVEELYAAPAAGGVEFRFNLCFRALRLREAELTGVTGAQLVQEEEGESRRPSLVLRRVACGEELWSLARDYRTTVEEIMAVNHLSDEVMEEEKMLLIPR